MIGLYLIRSVAHSAGGQGCKCDSYQPCFKVKVVCERVGSTWKMLKWLLSRLCNPTGRPCQPAIVIYETFPQECL